MSIQVISQSLSDICLNLQQSEKSDYFLYGLSSGLPSYGLQTSQLRTSDVIAPNQQVRVVLPPTGLLAPMPLLIKWAGTMTKTASTNAAVYSSLFCWKTIDFRSAGNIIYSLTPQSIIQFMSYTLSASAYTTWISMISFPVLTGTSNQTADFYLPLLLPSYTDASNLLDLKRSQSNYDLVFTMDAVANWAGTATAWTQTSSLTIDYNWIDLSEADERNYIENTYLKSDSSLTKAGVIMVSDVAQNYIAGAAYNITRARVIEQIHFYFYTNPFAHTPLDACNNSPTPSVSINLGSGTITIPLIALKSFQLFGNGRNLTSGVEQHIYTVNLAVAKNSSAFVGGLAGKSASNAYISFSGLDAAITSGGLTPSKVAIFYSTKSIMRYSALSGVATEVSTS